MRKPKFIHAQRMRIKPHFMAVAEIDYEKVAAIAEHLANGGEVPEVVTAGYSGKQMPLDGHHRMAAHAMLGRDVAAFVVTGDTFDYLDTLAQELEPRQRAEDFIMCAGIPAMKYATEWDRQHAP